MYCNNKDNIHYTVKNIITNDTYTFDKIDYLYRNTFFK